MNAVMAIEPVRRSITVEAPLEHAFRVFTEGIATWWPLHTHSVFDDASGTVEFETREGGRIVERSRDAQESTWGEVLVWEPPHRVVLNWHPARTDGRATEVEFRFQPEGSGTRVDLEHRRWEQLGEDAERQRASYESGWPGVLAHYERVVG